MRDYALTQAHATGAVGFSLATLLINWRARRTVARLEHCEDRILHQLGIAREDVAHALRLPVSENAGLALEQFTFARQRKLAAAREQGRNAHARREPEFQLA
jgi:hypothetical protein